MRDPQTQEKSCQPLSTLMTAGGKETWSGKTCILKCSQAPFSARRAGENPHNMGDSEFSVPPWEDIFLMRRGDGGSSGRFIYTRARDREKG